MENLSTTKEPTNRMMEAAEALAQAAGTPAPNVQLQYEQMQEEQRRRVIQLRHAEIKREVAPVSLGLIAGAISAVLSFTSHKEREVRGIIRNLRGDQRSESQAALRKAASSRNERLDTLVEEYDRLEARYNDIRKTAQGESKRQNLSAWLSEEYTKMKQMDQISVNEVLDKRFNKYREETITAYDGMRKDIAAYCAKHNIAAETVQDEEHLRKISSIYEKAYIGITSARQEFREAVDKQVLLKIRQGGKRLGFKDLTAAAKQRSIVVAGVFSLATAAGVYWLVKALTRESAEERRERQALQVSGEWQRTHEGEDELLAPVPANSVLQSMASHAAAVQASSTVNASESSPASTDPVSSVQQQAASFAERYAQKTTDKDVVISR